MKAHASRSNQSGDQGRAQASSEYGTRQSLSDIGDTAPFLDILPQAELTPKVSQALQALMSQNDRLRRDLNQSKARLAELEEIADTDPLLPVLNRRAFVRELTRIMSFAERYDVHASMLYFDLDNLKAINDRHGHDAGDAALNHVARLLTNNVRASDAVGRLGGDEFGVMLARADLATALRKGEALADLIKTQSVQWKGHLINVTTSLGAYSFQQGENPDSAIAQADKAMYKQKSGRKNTIGLSLKR
jgi:diguanylate cyclase (GGDEF)-like protein